MAEGKKDYFYFSVFICLATRQGKTVELYMYAGPLYHRANRDIYVSIYNNNLIDQIGKLFFF